MATLLSQQPAKVMEEAVMAQVYQKVQELVRLVDDFASTSQAHEPQHESVRLAYQDFTRALETLNSTVLGPDAKPLATTRAWAPILLRWRYYVCSLFSWGLLTEQAVAEAANILKTLGVVGLIDPLAGSGWHALLWQEVGGLAVLAMDSYAVEPAWAEVSVVEDSRTVAWNVHPSDPTRWALLLSWPPHSPETVGSDLLEKFEGTYFLYLGEQAKDGALSVDTGLTGGQEFLRRISEDWELVQAWQIPKWPGFADDLKLYRRRKIGKE